MKTLSIRFTPPVCIYVVINYFNSTYRPGNGALPQ